jgi:hypothetical protein
VFAIGREDKVCASGEREKGKNKVLTSLAAEAGGTGPRKRESKSAKNSSSNFVECCLEKRKKAPTFFPLSLSVYLFVALLAAPAS